jgi:hypothetical protein
VRRPTRLRRVGRSAANSAANLWLDADIRTA